MGCHVSYSQLSQAHLHNMDGGIETDDMWWHVKGFSWGDKVMLQAWNVSVHFSNWYDLNTKSSVKNNSYKLCSCWNVKVMAQQFYINWRQAHHMHNIELEFTVIIARKLPYILVRNPPMGFSHSYVQCYLHIWESWDCLLHFLIAHKKGHIRHCNSVTTTIT